jgi:putative lipoprotein
MTMDRLLICLCLSLGGRGDARAPKPADRFFGEDKFQHFFTSFLVTSLAASGARLAGAGHDSSLLIGAGTGATVGALKELHDARNPAETASLLDLVWDAGGVALATAIVAQAK